MNREGGRKIDRSTAMFEIEIEIEEDFLSYLLCFHLLSKGQYRSVRRKKKKKKKTAIKILEIQGK